jgi:hypothetical protein
VQKNVAGQVIGAQLFLADGTSVTSGTTTVYVTIDGGTQATGTGTVTHEGNGFWSYAPTQAETNGDHIAFTFANNTTNAVSVVVQVYTQMDANVAQWLGTAVVTPATAGTPDVNVKSITSGAITAGSIAAAALNGKGDWNIGKTGYSLTQTFPTNFADLAITATTGKVTVGTNDDKTGYSLTQTFPTNFSDLAITATTGRVTVGTNADKTGYSISGTKTTLDALNDIAATEIVSAGAITTNSGAVANVDLVDTCTTNTDMRGTDGANTVAPDNASIAAILIDTADMQPKLGTPVADISADIAAVKSDSAAILVDTSDMQPKIGTPAADVSADIAAVKSDTAAILTDTGTTLDTKLNNIQGATFDTATDSLEAIRNRGDAAWTTGAGGSPPQLLLNTTIATLASQTSFTLTSGSTDDKTYNGAMIIVTDSATATQKAVGSVSTYIGSTKTITLESDPAVFTMSAGDTVDIIANISSSAAASASSTSTTSILSTGGTLQKTRNDIIDFALTLCGAKDQEEAASGAAVMIAAQALDDMIKEWQTSGAHLWSRNFATIFLQPGQRLYTLGGSTTDKATESFVETTSTADEVAGSTSVTIADSTGMSINDNIGIETDSLGLSWGVISAITPTVAPAATITFTGALKGDSASGKKVFAYTTDIGKPLRIPTARRIQSSGGTDQEIEMIQTARLDYERLPNKLSSGIPVQFYYDPKISDGDFYVWPVPATSSLYINITYYRPLNIFDTSATAPDFPNEWLSAIKYQLAVRCFGLFGLPVRNDIVAIAERALESVQSWDTDSEPINFSYDDTGSR